MAQVGCGHRDNPAGARLRDDSTTGRRLGCEASGTPGVVSLRTISLRGSRTPGRKTGGAMPRRPENTDDPAEARAAARRGERRMREARREALASSRRLKLALEVA